MNNRAIGVLKKRTSDFEKTLREVTLSSNGVEIGKELTELSGLLRGLPELGKGHRQ
jgi:circadian clock protein KaiC